MINKSESLKEQPFEVRIASNFIERARGLLFSDPQPRGHLLYFPNCRAVHTFGMRYPLTVIFFDEENHVLRVVQKVNPNRIITCLRARAVCETTWRPDTSDEVLDVIQLEMAVALRLARNRKQK